MPAKAAPPWMGALSKAFAPTCLCPPKICQLVAMATRLAYEEHLELPELLQDYAHERPAGAQTPADQAARRARVAAMQKATEELGATEDRNLKLELLKKRSSQQEQQMQDLEQKMEGFRQVGEAGRAFLHDQVSKVPSFWVRQAREQHEGNSHRGLSGTLGWPGEECRLCFVCHAVHPRMTANGPDHKVCQPPSLITGKTAQKHIGTKNAGGHSAHESAYELRRAIEARARREAREQQERAQEQGKRQGKQELRRKQVKRQDKNKRRHEWAERTQATGETRPVQDKDVLDPGLLDGESTCTELTEENMRARTRQRARVADSGGAGADAGGGGAGAGGAGAGGAGGKWVRLGDGEDDSDDSDVETQADDLGDPAALDAEDELDGSDSSEWMDDETPWPHDDTNPSWIRVPGYMSTYNWLSNSKQTAQTATINATTYASMQH
jgi:hypothetical protein